eukprot:12933919-Prorocentrum_lima.AAC.1
MGRQGNKVMSPTSHTVKQLFMESTSTERCAGCIAGCKPTNRSTHLYDSEQTTCCGDGRTSSWAEGPA